MQADAVSPHSSSILHTQLNFSPQFLKPSPPNIRKQIPSQQPTLLLLSLSRCCYCDVSVAVADAVKRNCFCKTKKTSKNNRKREGE